VETAIDLSKSDKKASWEALAKRRFVAKPSGGKKSAPMHSRVLIRRSQYGVDTAA